jgi:hypothetical protein
VHNYLTSGHFYSSSKSIALCLLHRFLMQLVQYQKAQDTWRYDGHLETRK